MFTNIPSYPDISRWTDWLGNFRFTGQTVGDIISYLLPIIFATAGIALLIYLLIGGFKLLTSGGDPKSVASGQKILTHAIIGFLIVIASYWLAQIIGVVFNINVLAPGASPPVITCVEECALQELEGACTTVGDCTEIEIGWINCPPDQVCCCRRLSCAEECMSRGYPAPGGACVTAGSCPGTNIGSLYCDPGEDCCCMPF